MSLNLADAAGRPIQAPQKESAVTRIQRDEGFKKLAAAEKKALKDSVIGSDGNESIAFRDYSPAPGVVWRQHLHLGDKPCPFRLDPAPGTIVCLRKQKPLRTTSGVWLAETMQEPNSNRFAIVIDVGESYVNEHGVTREKPPLKVGDEIVTTKTVMCEPDGKDWPIVVVPFEYLLGVVRRADQVKASGPVLATE